MTMKYERRSNNRSCSRLGRFRSRGRVRLGRSLRGMKLAVPVLVLAMMISGCVFLPWFTTEIAVAQTSDLSYPIVDTNQELAYDNANALTIEPSVGSSFFGQDAQIDGNQPNLQGTGVPPVPGILSILPATLAPGEQSVMLRIVLNPALDPPEQVQFTSIAIADIEAIVFTHSIDIREYLDLRRVGDSVNPVCNGRFLGCRSQAALISPISCSYVAS